MASTEVPACPVLLGTSTHNHTERGMQWHRCHSASSLQLMRDRQRALLLSKGHQDTRAAWKTTDQTDFPPQPEGSSLWSVGSTGLKSLAKM